MRGYLFFEVKNVAFMRLVAFRKRLLVKLEGGAVALRIKDSSEKTQKVSVKF